MEVEPQCPYQVGDRVDFVPTMINAFGEAQTVRGTVIAVNEKHRHYTVEGRLNGVTIRETFKF